MNGAINERKSKSAEQGSTLQPQLYHVIDVDVFYLTVNEAIYELHNILKAVDIAIKAHAVLNLQYDNTCKSVYTFFQRGFYEIETKYDHISPSLAVLLQELRSGVSSSNN